MKKISSFLAAFLLSAVILSACNTGTSNTDATAQTADPASTVPADSQISAGTVVETMNSGGYTYVLVDTGSEEFWAAAPEFAVSVGESVMVPAGMPMQNYHSKSLDRDFEVLLFVQEIRTGSATARGDVAAQAPVGLPPGHPQPAEASDTGVDYSDVSTPTGGLTVGQIYAHTDELSGKEIVLRAKVVKYNAGILGSNWLHVRDGSGEEGSNDLTVTTDAAANVGDTVLIKGILGIDRDIGSGYFFPVIIENATVTVE